MATDLTVPTWEAFAEEMNAPGRDWMALLPPNINPDKFRAVAITAIKQNPELLKCTARSLFNAISRAAQDGMLPDGREGFINSYNSKIGKNSDGKDIWHPVAQWQPMAYGFRKRARELDDIIIDAQVVYLNDRFVWHQGDHPSIEHTPVTLGSDQNRGAKVGAYAIFRKGGEILHREVMDFGQIEKAREKSKAPDSMMWKDFPEEGYRKTVLRRGIKTVPVSEAMAEIIKRDDEESFDVKDDPQTDVVIPPRPRESEFRRPAPKQVEAKPEPPTLNLATPEPERQRERVPAQQDQRTDPAKANSGEAPADKARTEVIKDSPDDEKNLFLREAIDRLADIAKVRDLPAFEDRIIGAGVLDEGQEKQFSAAVEKRKQEIKDAAVGKR